MKFALKKAIEGGYMPNRMSTAGTTAYKLKCILNWYDGVGRINAIFLDPLFWQAFVKATTKPHKTSRTWWKTLWHKFIDHLIEGKDADSFFKELLTNN